SFSRFFSSAVFFGLLALVFFTAIHSPNPFQKCSGILTTFDFGFGNITGASSLVFKSFFLNLLTLVLASLVYSLEISQPRKFLFCFIAANAVLPDPIYGSITSPLIGVRSFTN